LANIKSSQKKNRQRITHEARNRTRKSAMRTAIKALHAAIESKNGDQARKLLMPAVRLVDRAGRRGVIKPRTASRAVSRLTVAVNRMAAAAK
jgi:small subunit ribosomal protein S20